MSRWFFVLLRRTSRRFFLSLQELPLRRRAAHLAEPGPWAAPDGGRLGAQGAARPRRKDGDRDAGTGTLTPERAEAELGIVGSPSAFGCHGRAQRSQ